MKHIINPRALRLSPLLLALTLLLSCFVLPIAAEDTNRYTAWSYDPVTDTLTATFPEGDEVRYIRYDHTRLRYDEQPNYLYNAAVMIDGIEYCVYTSFRKDETLMLVDGNGNCLIYVTEPCKQELEEFLTEQQHTTTRLCYKVGDHYRVKGMGKSFHKEMRRLIENPATETLTDTLYGLRYAPRYELWAQVNNNDVLSVNVGFLFDLAGEMYYLNVFDLPDSAYAEDGSLKPSEDITVTLCRLPDEQAENAYEAVYNAIVPYTSESIERENRDALNDIPPQAFTYFTVILLGILLPIVPLILGLCLPHSKKQGYRKRWYLLAILGGVWMLLGILLLVLLIVAL